jgi:hypothetical protein
MALWTTHELRGLVRDYPVLPWQELRYAYRRHSLGSIRWAANSRGRSRSMEISTGTRAAQLAWLRLAHEYFAMREQQMKESK